MWPNPQLPVDLVTFTEEILHGKLLFLCGEICTINPYKGNVTVIKKQSIDWLPYDAKISLKWKNEIWKIISRMLKKPLWKKSEYAWEPVRI